MNAMNIVNERPLTYRPIERFEEPALTPNQLLKLSNADSSVLAEFNDDDLLGRKQWRIAQQLTKHFWKRFVQEYTPELTRRTKWFERTKPLEVGDAVIIVDSNAERNKWERARVVEVYPSRTGEVRWADVETTNGIIRKRSTKDLAVLDIK